MRAGRWRVLRERLPELRAETLLVFLFASKACEEGVSRRALEEKKTTEGTGPTDETRVDGRTSDPHVAFH